MPKRLGAARLDGWAKSGGRYNTIGWETGEHTDVCTGCLAQGQVGVWGLTAQRKGRLFPRALPLLPENRPGWRSVLCSLHLGWGLGAMFCHLCEPGPRHLTSTGRLPAAQTWKGGETAGGRGCLLLGSALLLSAWLGPACWHGLTAPVSGFWDSSLHTVPADPHGPPSEDVKQTAGLLWSLQTHQEAGPQHSLWAPRLCRAQHCPAGTSILHGGGSQFMSGLTLVLTYSFCNNPLSPNSKSLVFWLEQQLAAEILKSHVQASLTHPREVISTIRFPIQRRGNLWEVRGTLLPEERNTMGQEAVSWAPWMEFRCTSGHPPKEHKSSHVSLGCCTLLDSNRHQLRENELEF